MGIHLKIEMFLMVSDLCIIIALCTHADKTKFD